MPESFRDLTEPLSLLRLEGTVVLSLPQDDEAVCEEPFALDCALSGVFDPLVAAEVCSCFLTYLEVDAAGRTGFIVLPDKFCDFVLVPFFTVSDLDFTVLLLGFEVPLVTLPGFKE